VLLDLMMPKLDGFTLMETFAANEPARLRRIIVTSAASPTVIRERLKGAPFRILPKPFDIDDVLGVVRACVEQPVN
jgi:CheY-like chemotaxis protein